MPETPKQKPVADKTKPDEPENDSWAEDQKHHEYYYDDAHGYKVYSPDEEEKEDE